jgi:hypothetical protein
MPSDAEAGFGFFKRFKKKTACCPKPTVTCCPTAVSGCSKPTLQERAEQGDASSQAVLAHMYLKGEGVPQDYTEAAKWYRKAGEQGVASAQAVLGHLYRTGEGVPQDYAEAFVWDRRAAEQGIVTAQRVVGHAYRVGSGVKQDSVEAYAWFAVAASSSGVDAAQTRDEVRTEVKPQLVGQAEELAAEYIKRYGNSDTSPDEQAVKPRADTEESTNAATVEPQMP